MCRIHAIPPDPNIAENADPGFFQTIVSGTSLGGAQEASPGSLSRH